MPFAVFFVLLLLLVFPQGHAALSTGQAAGIVIGQSTFGTEGSATTQTGLNSPVNSVFDPSGDLWVVELTNSRVLEYLPGTGGCPSGQFCNGMAASVVIGQPSFTSSTVNSGFASCNGVAVTAGAVSACGLSTPKGIAFDALTGDLWVSDFGNNRVLEYVPGTGGCSVGFCNGMAASVVIGQPNFNSNTANAGFASCDGSPVTSGTDSACGLGGPRGIVFDASDNLWITDNNRVLEYSNLVEAITPSPVTIDTGQAITLTSHSTGGFGPYTYQWYTAPSPGTCTASDTSLGATTSTYSVPSSTTPGTYNYCYVITDSTGASGGSPTDAVTVDAITIGAITPASPTIDSGSMITLTSAAPTGGTGGGFTYQWYSGTSATCSSDPTALGTALAQVVSPTSNTDYCVQVTDAGVTPGAGPLFSSTDLVAVSSGLIAGAIAPSSTSIDSGQSITLTANPSGGTTPYYYQWYTGAGCTSPISGAASSTYTTGPLTSDTTYYYEVTDSAHPSVSACSAGTTVSVIPPLPDTTGGVFMPVGSTFTDAYGNTWLTPGGSAFGNPLQSYFFVGPATLIPSPMQEGWGGVYGTYGGQLGWIVTFY